MSEQDQKLIVDKILAVEKLVRFGFWLIGLFVTGIVLVAGWVWRVDATINAYHSEGTPPFRQHVLKQTEEVTEIKASVKTIERDVLEIKQGIKALQEKVQ